MSDLIQPAIARHPAEAVELVCVAISDGDLDAALAQYEQGAELQPWARTATGPDISVRQRLSVLMELRLPVASAVCAVVPAGDIALVQVERRIVGTGPDCEKVNLFGFGAAVIRRQPGGAWRIAIDAWLLSGPGDGATE